MPPRKRKAAEQPEAPEPATSRRRSARVSSSGHKSQYFESDPESSNEAEGEKPTSKNRETKSGRRKSQGKKARTAADDEDDYEDAEVNGQEKEQSDEDEEEFDEEAPPKVTFIPLVKLREEGGVPYEDTRVHNNTLLFLKDLKANNKRSWLKSHDEEYRRSLKDWQSYVETLTQVIIEKDETIPELPYKDIIFRIYRDIRFSNDPTPYKPHYSAAWSRTGRKGPYACYYVHLEPGKCFMGGGLWHPEGSAVARLRASIDERPRRWRRVLCDPAFRRTFFPEVKASKSKGKSAVEEDEKAVLQAFANGNRENALKTKPKGFNADHRDIELLKLRNYTVGKKLPDVLFTTPDGQAEIAEAIGAMVGFVTHLNNIVMPDPGMDDDDSEDEDEDEDEDDNEE